MDGLRIQMKCKGCGHNLTFVVTLDMLGSQKNIKCPFCGAIHKIYINPKLMDKFPQAPKTQMPSVDDGMRTVVRVQNNKDNHLILEVIGNENTKPQAFAISQEYNSIGRKNNSGPSCRPDIEIETNDGYMSKKHIVIRHTRTGYTLEDVGSKNGTFYNGKKLEAGEVPYLKTGDKIRIGHTELKITIK